MELATPDMLQNFGQDDAVENTGQVTIELGSCSAQVPADELDELPFGCL